MADRRTGAGTGRAAAPGDAPLEMAGLEDAVGFALRRAQLAVFADYGAAVQDLGVTAAQFAVLRLVNANPGAKQMAIAAALGIEAPRTAFVLDELARRGLLERRASPTDRRARALFLTQEGKQIHRMLSRREAAHAARMTARLRGEDRAALLRMLHNLATPL
jgi:DNA-binding MarR family transcriptional regulator